MDDYEGFLDTQLCFALYVSSKEVIKKYTTLLKEFDLTYTAYIVIMAIEKDERINIKTLDKRVYLDSGTLTPLLKKLEKKDIIIRNREIKDERHLYISLTNKGLKLKPKLKEISNQVFGNFDITNNEANTLIQMVRNALLKKV